ncbi:MAG: hemolysin III family protein [Alphaproteobacteria bacterium]
MALPDLSTTAIAHYLTRGERIADRWVHVVGLVCGIGGGVLLVGMAIAAGGIGRVSAVTIYAACLIAMLACSAAYNLAQGAKLQRRLRRFDHAAIFLLIAGSYTPFTTQRFEGVLAVAMTLAVWAIALVAAAGKLFLPGIAKKLWLPVYLLLGWMVVGAIGPLIDGVRPAAVILLAVGGVIYSVGVLIYIWQKLPYRRAIWHGFVVAAAGAHYAAVMTGVVLA